MVINRPLVIIIAFALGLLLFASHAAVPPKQARGCIVGNDLSRGVSLYHTTCVTDSKGESHEIALY